MKKRLISVWIVAVTEKSKRERIAVTSGNLSKSFFEDVIWHWNLITCKWKQLWLDKSQWHDSISLGTTSGNLIPLFSFMLTIPFFIPAFFSSSVHFFPTQTKIPLLPQSRIKQSWKKTICLYLCLFVCLFPFIFTAISIKIKISNMKGQRELSKMKVC